MRSEIANLIHDFVTQLVSEKISFSSDRTSVHWTQIDWFTCSRHDLETSFQCHAKSRGCILAGQELRPWLRLWIRGAFLLPSEWVPKSWIGPFWKETEPFYCSSSLFARSCTIFCCRDRVSFVSTQNLKLTLEASGPVAVTVDWFHFTLCIKFFT